MKKKQATVVKYCKCMFMLRALRLEPQDARRAHKHANVAKKERGRRQEHVHHHRKPLENDNDFEMHLAGISLQIQEGRFRLGARHGIGGEVVGLAPVEPWLVHLYQRPQIHRQPPV